MIRTLALATLAAVLTACTQTPPPNTFDDVTKHADVHLTKQLHWSRGGPADQQIQDHIRTMLQRPMRVDDAVQIALLNNRQLQATYEELGISQAELAQAGLLKNPTLSASLLPGIDGTGSPKIGLELTYDFIDALFLGVRQRMAALALDGAKARVTAAVLAHALEARIAFYEYQAAEQLLELQQLHLDAASVSNEASQKLFDAGNITRLTLMSDRASLSRAKLAFSEAQTMLTERRERVNRALGLWGVAAGTWRADGRLLPLPQDEIALTGIEGRAIKHSLQLAELRTDAAAAHGQRDLVQWSAWFTDIEAGVAAEQEDTRAWHVGPTVTLQIPIFDQGQARNAAAEARLRSVMQRYTAAAVTIRSTVRVARDQYVAARARATHARDVLVPTQNEVLKETQLQYNAMQVSLFQLLAARRDVTDAGATYITSLRDYWLARAQLEHLLAGGNGAAGMTTDTPSRPSSASPNAEGRH